MKSFTTLNMASFRLLLMLAWPMAGHSQTGLQPKCFDFIFVSAFVEYQYCLTGNDAVSCVLPYALAGAAAGAAFPVSQKIMNTQRNQEFPLSIDDKKIEEHFKRIPGGEKVQSEIDALKKSSQGLVNDAAKKAIRDHLAWLELKKKYLVSNELSDDFTGKTIKTLKDSGYNTREIETARTAMSNYIKELREAQLRIGMTVDSFATKRQTIQRQLFDVESKLDRDPKNSKLLNNHRVLKSELEMAMKKERLDSYKQDALGNPRTRLQIELEKIVKGPPLARAATKAALKGGAIGAIVASSPGLKQTYDLHSCLKKLNVTSTADQESLIRYGRISDSECTPEIDPTKVWNMLLMNPADRDQLFHESPTLCRAFENTFQKISNDLAKTSPQIDLENTKCEESPIRTQVKVDGHIYPWSVKMMSGEIEVTGSFVSGNDLGELKGHEKFHLRLLHDQTWSGLRTNNPTWGSIPGVGESFSNGSKASDPDLGRDLCRDQAVLSSKDRTHVNLQGSSRKLMCAAHHQVIAAKALLPYLVSYCDRKKGLNTRSNGTPPKPSTGTQ